MMRLIKEEVTVTGLRAIPYYKCRDGVQRQEGCIGMHCRIQIQYSTRVA